MEHRFDEEDEMEKFRNLRQSEPNAMMKGLSMNNGNGQRMKSKVIGDKKRKSIERQDIGLDLEKSLDSKPEKTMEKISGQKRRGSVELEL